MKTSQTREVRKVDDRTSVEARSRSRVSAARSRTGRVVRRTVIAVLVLLLIAVVAVAVVYTASDTAIQQPALEESQLFDRSVRARDGVAVDGQRDTLFDRSVRAREH